ncbi:MAG TPA: transglutaminase domain-containing protein [Armatimonadota bacterium]|nr:transglutaminase domain-containing protein [Armatimonadota bacterium]
MRGPQRVPAAVAAALASACAVWEAGRVLGLEPFTRASLSMIALGYASATMAHWWPVAAIRALVLAALVGVAFAALRPNPPDPILDCAQVLQQKSGASILVGLVFAVVFLSFVAGTYLRGRRVPMVATAVPALSIYGLAGVFTSGFSLQVSFSGFLFAAVYAMAYEHLLSQSTPATGSFPPRRSARSALGLAAGYLALLLPLSFPLASLSQRMTPGLTPAERDRLRRTLFSTDDDPGYSRLSETVSLAGGMRTTGEQALMRVKTTTPGLLRGRIYDVYERGCWSQSQLIETSIPLGDGPVGRRGRRAARRHAGGLDASDAREAAREERRRYFTHPPRHSRPPQEHARRVTQQMDLLGRVPGSVLCAGIPLEVITTREDLTVDVTGLVFGKTDWREGDTYTVVSEVPDVPEPLLRRAPGGQPPEEGHWIQIPVSVAPVRELALTIAGKERTPYARAEAIADYLRAHCRYSLSVPSAPRDEDPIVHFLTTGRKGACDLFAGATAVLCRALGIPTRLVTGYLLTELDDDGTYLVRERDAHAWVEIYTEPYGWIPFDPTPGNNTPAGSPSGREWQAGWSKLSPRGLTFLAEALLLGILGAVVAGARGKRRHEDASIRFRPRASDAHGETQHAYHQACRHLARRGVPRQVGQTAEEYLAVVRESGLPEEIRVSMEALTDLFEQACYAPAGSALPDAGRARVLAATIRKLPRRWKRS